MGFAGYVTVCMQLYCVDFHCLSLHVSAYMVIFKCVGYFYFQIPKGFCCFFFAFFSRGHTLHISICVFPVLFSFVNFVVSDKQQEKASRQTHTQETTKLTKENSTGKTQMDTCRV
jgi:hypothetical protein